jgi:hypothetical protein
MINKVRRWTTLTSDSRFRRDGSFNARSLGHAVAVFDDPRDSLWLNIIVLIARFRIYSNSGSVVLKGMAREKL